MQILLDAVADTRRGGLHGIAGEMSVPGGRLYLGVTEQFADHWQTLPERQRARGEGVAKVMNAHILQAARARSLRHAC